MPTLVLVRHGQSVWNQQNRFTGWVDVDLTDQGVAEARKAGELLAAEDTRFDAAFTSFQKRAIRTLWMALEGIDQMHIPVTKAWQLNERHYGALTGLNKDETKAEHGEEQVRIWRRAFDTPPPQIDPSHEHHPANDPKYAGYDPAILPGGESLKMTTDRVLPYFNANIRPMLDAGANLIVSAHGNSLRALMKDLFDVSNDDIPGFEFPTGNPLLLELGDGQSVESARYLDETRAKALPEFRSGANAQSGRDSNPR
ncbi:2,3-diphosphoglycerate-dependent phosphoglycerate mutase [uncultured Algimonas sp.]|uniref:2,3-diphosphoglycerate-dependent phosphoglycerate mutase n=1 Tax=uncultured Algimonas sp. TaxID=1547920 RepID=UPI0026231C48|nr:2,3-diphosphoglycerate-dependent phosphoglycerate mutase [uncultured Algimonas sp.]